MSSDPVWSGMAELGGAGLEYTQFQAKHKNLNNESTGSISEPQDFKIFWGMISPDGSPTVHIGACVARLWAPPLI